MSESIKVKGHVRDMTQGGILSHILIFAIPMILANVCQQLYSLVDTMVAGQNLGDSAIAAIGAVTALYGFILNFAIGINAGSAIVVTQYFGSHNVKKLKQSLMGMFKLDMFFTVVITALAMIFMHPLLRFMNVPASVYDDAYLYIIVICGGMVCTIAYNMGASILRAFGNSREPLIYVVVGSILHIVLDYVFIAWLKTGVVGAAVSTLVSNAAAAFLSFAYIIRNYKEYVPSMEDWKVPKEILGELSRIGTSMALTFSVIDLGDVVYGSASNALGEVYIASYAAARRIINVLMVPINTTASACTTFVGQNWGAEKYDRIKSAIKQLFMLEVTIGLVIFAIGYIFASPMVKIVSSSTDPEILANATKVLHFFFPLYAPLGVLFTFRCSLQGMGCTRPALIAGGIEMAGKVVSAIWLVPEIGFLATCITEPATWVINAIFLAISYFVVRKSLFSGERS